MDVNTLVVATGFGLDLDRFVVRDILERLAGFGHKFLHLVEVDFAVGIDGGFAIGLAVEHILIHMGIQLDVAALGLEFHVVEVQAVLVLVNGAAGILDLQAAALLTAEVLDGHLEVLAVILQVVDVGIEILHLDIVGIQCGAGLVGFLAGLPIFSLAVLDTHLARLDLPGLVIAVGAGCGWCIVYRWMGFFILLGILFAGVFILHVGLVDIEFAHINGLFSGIDYHILGLGMAHLGIKVIDGGLHVHLKVQIVGSDFVGIDFPGFARLLVWFGFLLLRFVAHLGFSALERRVTHIHLVVIQVHRRLVNLGLIHVHVKVH